MTAKELNQAIENFFADIKSKDCVTYEALINLFDKQPTAAHAKTIFKLIQKNKVCIYTASEHAKKLNFKEAEARKDAQRKMLEDSDAENFDILKEHELLEWSRSDSHRENVSSRDGADPSSFQRGGDRNLQKKSRSAKVS